MARSGRWLILGEDVGCGSGRWPIGGWAGRMLALAGCVVVAVLCLAGVAVAGESPRWAVLSTATPTNVKPGSPRNEVQDVSVDATGGTFTLTVESPFGDCSATETTAPIVYAASAAEVQAALEALSCTFAAGSVTVSGGPGGSSPYAIEFTGNNFGERPRPAGLSVDGAGLTGVGAGASVTEAAEGTRAPELIVSATNVGGASTDGSAIVLEDTLPPGMTATSVFGYDAYHSGLAGHSGGAAMSCSTGPTVVCEWGESVDPGDQLVMFVTLAVSPGASGSPGNLVSVSGGGAASASASIPVSVGGAPASFGPEPNGVLAAVSSLQAGAHPNATAAFVLNTEESDAVSGDAKDVRFDLPPGLVGTIAAMPQCTIKKVVEEFVEPNGCPADTMVGMAVIALTEGTPNTLSTLVTPVYNISPGPGEPAAFAFNAYFLSVRLDTSVLSDGNYGVRIGVSGISQAAELLSTSVTIWGIPADHNGPGPDTSIATFFGGQSFGGPASGSSRRVLLSAPQQCSQELSATMEADSWEAPGVFRSEEAPMGTLTGCGLLSLGSSLSVLPDTLEAGEPAGYSVGLGVPQSSGPEALATPNVRDVKVTLPEGTVIDPSAAQGLAACSSAEFYGSERGLQEPAQPGHCPRGAQVGTVEVKTPALSEPLTGEVYLAEPECDPCTPADAEDGRMARLFLQVVGEGESGVVVKSEGRAEIDQATGRIVTLFEDQPPLPFSELKLTLGGGPRAVLANPRACGPVTSVAELTPWSTPLTEGSLSSSGFEVNEDCIGQQFSPTFQAGTTNVQAGEYTPFTTAFGRTDADEQLAGLEMHLPPGFSANLSSVSLCGEPQAAEGACGSGSLIGHVQVLTGPGAEPFLVSGGKVFITGPYKGAPFGLSIVVPAVAGPYTLSGTTGKGTVVVRGRVLVDPVDAHLTVITDPLPTALDGIPLQLKAVSATVDRAGFAFNPTSCAKMSLTGVLSSTEGASASVVSPFQVTNCAALGFKPGFKVSTSAKTSRIEGASLHVALTLPPGGEGKEANVARVKVSLPKQLPSPLKTLQKACLEKVFAENPANCPVASRVGEAKVSTPILEGPLSGPAYFVSHGGARYPELIMVLTGEDGVTVDVHGETFISKQGITSATFSTVPDVPFSNFELTLPEREFPALTANGNLCKGTLLMPTEMVGQNGIVIKQSTKIAVTGCPKAKKMTHHKKKVKAKRKRRRG